LTVSQYDDIGESYEGVKTLPMARYPERHSFLRMLGDVDGLKVLDLACGTGFYTRQIRGLGARDVLGVDISPDMIAAATEIERRSPVGVRYAVADAAELPSTERPFDVVTAVYLLNYAADEASMRRLCRSVYDSLADGGTFLVLTQNPTFRFDGPDTRKYGFTYVPVGTGPIGPRVSITAQLDPSITFEANYPPQEVYERALDAAGFSGVEWVPLHVPDEGTKEFGEQFWEDFLVNPPLTMLRCGK
jgi:SAM-dependent methyltransferase